MPQRKTNRDMTPGELLKKAFAVTKKSEAHKKAREKMEKKVISGKR